MSTSMVIHKRSQPNLIPEGEGASGIGALRNVKRIAEDLGRGSGSSTNLPKSLPAFRLVVKPHPRGEGPEGPAMVKDLCLSTHNSRSKYHFR